MTNLFRTEALRAHRDHHLGTIRIGRNPSHALITGLAILCASALVALAAWGQVNRKVKVAGVLAPMLGSLPVSATSTGVLVEMRVRDGDAVEAGQPLFVVDTDRTSTVGDTAVLVAQSLAARRAALQAERSARDLQARQREQALSEQLRTIEAQLRQALDETQLATRRVELATATVQRYQKLAREGFVAELQAQQRQEELIDLQGRQRAAERSRVALQRDAQTLRADRTATLTQLQTDLAQMDRAFAALTQESAENDARRRLIVAAPRPGVVSAVTVHIGQALQQGQTLATLLPRGADGQPSELGAQLFAPSRTAGFVQAGQQVWLRYAAYPYQKFGMHRGRVTAVSDTPISPQDLPGGQANALLAAAQSNEPLYRIDVQLDAQSVVTYGQVRPLKPGMALDADVMQDRRALWEWVLEPVLAASARVKVLGGQ